MVDYEFYTGVFRGSSVSQENWPALERDASSKLRQYKKNYTVTASCEIAEAMAVCAMAEVLDYYEAAMSGTSAVQSASIGSVSVNYGSAISKIDLSPKGQEKSLYRAACQYLDIYRGC